MTEFTVNPEEEDYEPEKYDFNAPETVLIQVDVRGLPQKYGWKNHQIVRATIIDGPEDVCGAARYDESYGAGLGWTIESMCDEPEKDGWYVVEGITGVYHQGNGWDYDDDMDFYFTGFRAATEEEIKMEEEEIKLEEK